jgi:polyisoprenoid-binding protein YceI
MYKRLFGGIVGGGLVVALIVGYVVFFSGNTPVEVDSVEAAEARQEAIAEATGGANGGVQSDEADEADEAEEDESSAALDTGQPDSNASVGSTTNGLWMVDTSIGTFGADCLTDVCGSSFVGFRIDEELANFGAKTVVGRTPGVSGSMELVGTQVIGAEFVVDMTGLITDNDSRTGALRGPNGGIETDAFPEARFELTQSIELGSVPAEGASIDVWATGNLSLHGVTNEVVIPLTAEVQAGVIIVFGNLEGILLADYGIPKPTAVVVVSVEDNATLELQLFFSR